MHYAIAGDSVNSYAYDNSSVKMVSQSLAIKDDLLEFDLENYSDYLADNGEFILASFDKAGFLDNLVLCCFDSINGDGIAGNEFACLSFTGGETGLNKNVDEFSADLGSRETFSQEV